MSNKLHVILAINPGSRYLGISFFYGYALRDWQIKNVRGCSEKQRFAKARDIILRLIERHNPDVVVVKKLYPSRASIYLKKLGKQIEQSALRRKIRVYSYSINQVKDFFLNDKPKNKVRLAEALANRYPGLMYEFKKELFNKNPYHTRVFEAIALGAICCDQLK